MNHTAHSKFYTLLITLGVAGIFASCKEKDKVKEPELGKYVLAFRAQNGAASSSEGDADYLITSNDLMSGTLSATGVGIE
ncbi:MAG TPA: hypothetical protein VL947_03905, partial [Cytophagales bacterium]|nr:hypothetical protein [Cytophagales bacterium]